MRERSLGLWLALGVLLVAVLNLPSALTQAVKNTVREFVAPIQEAATGFTRSVREGVSSIRGLGGLMSENQRMSAELARLMAEVNELKSLERENEQLRRALDFHLRARRDLIPAEIIARSRDGWWQTLRVNKGASDGLRADLPVISLEGLVGKVASVSEHTADVLLLSDPTCRVAAQVLRTGAHGIVAGRGPNWEGQVICRMEFINKNTAVMPGDEVVTSGLGGVFPRGLLIGYVESVSTDRSGLYQTANVISKSGLGTLAYVYAVRAVSPDAPYLQGEHGEGLP